MTPPTLILPVSRFAQPTSPNDDSYGGMSMSELVMLSATDPTSPERLNVIVMLIKSLNKSPFLISYLPPSAIKIILNELASKPLVLNSIEPLNVVGLIDILCGCPFLLKVAPDRTVSELITTIVLSPKILEVLRPSTVVCLLNKVPPAVLLELPLVVKVLLIRHMLSPNTFDTLTPAEISVLINVLVNAERALAVFAAPGDILQFLNTVVLSPTFTNNISATQAVDLLSLLSKIAPALDGIPQDLIDTLLASITASVNHLSAAVLGRLMPMMTNLPLSLNLLDPAAVALLLPAFSQISVLSIVPPPVIVQLLVDLKATTVADDVIIGLLHGVVSVLPSLLCDVPPTVLSTFANRLTSPGVTGSLLIDVSVKLMSVLSKAQCLLSALTASSVKETVTFVTSNDTLLNAIPSPEIVDIIHTLAGTGLVLPELPPEKIQKLLSFLTSVSSMRALDSVHYSKLLSLMALSPYLTSALTGTRLLNLLHTLTSVPGALQATPNSVIAEFLTQLFMMPDMLSDIPFPLLLDLLTQIENQTSGAVFCAIPPSVIDKFTEFLGANNASIITSLPAADLTALVGLLAKANCLLARLSMETLNALFEAINAAPFAVPLEVIIKLIVAIHSLLPSVLCSLPPDIIGDIFKSFGSFDFLDGLNTTVLGELLTAVSTSSCLLSAFDLGTIQAILEYLSTSQSILSDLNAGDLANLVVLISANQPLRTFMPMGCTVRFLLAINLAKANSLPTAAALALLKPLISKEQVINKLKLTEAENLIDLLTTDKALLAASSPTLLVNLLTELTNLFAGLPLEKIVNLLVATHSALPSLLCSVPKSVLAALLDLIFTQSAGGCLLPKNLAAFVAVLSTYPCLIDAMPATTLESLLGLLSSQSLLTAEILPPQILANLGTILALTSSVLQNINISFIVSLLSAAGSKVCAIPAMALFTLLAPLSDAKTVYELPLSVIASLLRVIATAPCVLDILAGPILNTVVIKMASSPQLLRNLSPNLLLSVSAAIGSSPPALESLRPTTLSLMITSFATDQPSVLSDMLPATASSLLGAFGSQQALASLPPPTLNALIEVLINFPKLFTALPLLVLDVIFRFFVSSPAVLGAILSCTLIKFLAVLSSIQSLLRALPPSTLIAFIEALSTVSSKLLCAIPAPITTALFEVITTGPALATLTPTAVASLISALDTSPYLISILPSSLLTALITFLAANPSLLSNTPRPALLTFIQNVQTSRSNPCINVSNTLGIPCVVVSKFGDVTADSNTSSTGEPKTLSTGNYVKNSNILPNPTIINSNNMSGTPKVWGFPKN